MKFVSLATWAEKSHLNSLGRNWCRTYKAPGWSIMWWVRTSKPPINNKCIISKTCKEKIVDRRKLEQMVYFYFQNLLVRPFFLNIIQQTSQNNVETSAKFWRKGVNPSKVKGISLSSNIFFSILLNLWIKRTNTEIKAMVVWIPKIMS